MLHVGLFKYNEYLTWCIYNSCFHRQHDCLLTYSTHDIKLTADLTKIIHLQKIKLNSEEIVRRTQLYAMKVILDLQDKPIIVPL